MRRLGTFLGGLNFLVTFFLRGGGGGGFRIFIFCGYEDFVDIFESHDKIGLLLGVSFMYFRVLS